MNISQSSVKSHITEVPPAKPEDALKHFQARLSYETDCWDVWDSMDKGMQDFVLVDVRSANAYAKGHVPNAVSIPHRTITAERMTEYDRDTVFVVYCAGPHCNGANKGAVKLAKLGYQVKEMIGGVWGWLDEGFELVKN
jgi:rhodanese-related sulfurtransferase